MMSLLTCDLLYTMNISFHGPSFVIYTHCLASGRKVLDSLCDSWYIRQVRNTESLEERMPL